MWAFSLNAKGPRIAKSPFHEASLIHRLCVKPRVCRWAECLALCRHSITDCGMNVESPCFCSYWQTSVLVFVSFLFLWFLFIFLRPTPNSTSFNKSTQVLYRNCLGRCCWASHRSLKLTGRGKTRNPGPVTLCFPGVWILRGVTREGNCRSSSSAGLLPCGSDPLNPAFPLHLQRPGPSVSRGSAAWHFPALFILPRSYQQNQTTATEPHLFIFHFLANKRSQMDACVKSI